MALIDTLAALRHWPRWLPARRVGWAVGQLEVADARRLADTQRAAGEVPDGCAWLDDRTVDDLDLPAVFRAIDRTVTPSGAQALWRWLAAPAVRRDVLADRERRIAGLGDAARRGRLRDALAGPASADAPHLPRLLWEPAPAALGLARFAALAAVVVVLAALAWWWPVLVIAAVGVAVVNLLIDDWASLRLASYGRGLEVLAQTIAAAERVQAVSPDEARGRDVAVLAPLRRRIAWLTVKDPFGLADLVRGGLHVRQLWYGRAMRLIERERGRLRRLVLGLGELDAAIAIAALRAERADARPPELTDAPGVIAGDLVHPAIAGAVGNDLALAAGLILTGSNMSGKSTFLRTVAINAICAQSIHTVFGRWRADLVQVRAAMRSVDAPADGLSKYAVEVAAVGGLVAAAATRAHGLASLIVLDEPFSGTNPALRVPIVVAVLEHLAARDLVLAATHDLGVAAQLDPRFARAYFAEPDDATGAFDRKLRPGVSPGHNALALLVHAGYPAALIAAVERRIARDTSASRAGVALPE